MGFFVERSIWICLIGLCCANDLEKASADVLKYMSYTKVNTVFQSDGDSFLQYFEERYISTNVFDFKFWIEKMFVTTYKESSVNVIVGNFSWILELMKKIVPRFRDKSLSVERISFLLIDTSNQTSNYWKELKIVAELPKSMIQMLYIKESTKSRYNSSTILIEKFISEPQEPSLMELSGKWTEATRLSVLRPFKTRDKPNLNRKTVRLTHIQKPNIFTSTHSTKFETTIGYCAEIVRIFQRKLGFKAELSKTSGFGNYKTKGNGTGMIGDLMRNEADFAPLDFSPSESRRRGIDFSVELGTDSVSILTKAPGLLPRPFILFQVFTAMTRLYISLSVVFSGLMLATAFHVMGNRNQKNKKLFKQDVMEGLTIAYRCFVSQNCIISPSSITCSVILLFTILVALLVGILYKSIITSFLAIPVNTKAIDTVEDILDANLKIGLRKQTHFLNLVENGFFSEEIYERMKIRTFKSSVLQSRRFQEEITKFNYAVIDNLSAILGYRRQFEKPHAPCALYISQGEVKTTQDAFGLQRNSPFKKSFDHIYTVVFLQGLRQKRLFKIRTINLLFERSFTSIQITSTDSSKQINTILSTDGKLFRITWLRYYGIIEYLKKKFFASSCKVGTAKEGPQKLTLLQMQGSFFVLIIGNLFAFAAFLYELLYWKVNKFIRTLLQ